MSDKDLNPNGPRSYDMNEGGDLSKCPFHNGEMKQVAGGGTSNRDWWPNQLKMNIVL